MAERKSTITLDLAGTLWDKSKNGIELMKNLADNVDIVAQQAGKTATALDLLSSAAKGVAQSKAEATLKQMLEYMKEGASFGEAYAQAMKDVQEATSGGGNNQSRNMSEFRKEASEAARTVEKVSFGVNQLASVMGQSGNEAVRAFSEGLRNVGGILQSLPLGPVAVAVAVATAAFTTFAQIQRLTADETDKNKQALDTYLVELDKLKDPKAADALADLLGVTKEQAQAYMELASKNQDFAATLEEQINKVRAANDAAKGITEVQKLWDTALNNIKAGLTAFGMLAEAVIGKATELFNEWVRIVEADIAGIRAFFDTLLQGGNSTDALAAGQKAYAASIQATATAHSSASSAALTQAQAETALSNAYDMAAASGQNLWSVLQRLAQAESQMNEAIAQADAALVEQNAQLGERSAEAMQSYNEAIQNSRNQLSENISRIEKGLADNIASINQSLSQQLEQLAFQRFMQEKQFAHDMLVEQQKYQEQLRRLTIQTSMEIAKLDFDTHEQLQKAKTAREQDDIRRRALFQRGQINQQLAERRAQIDFEHKMAVQELSFKDYMNELQYQHQVKMASKAAAVQKAAAAEAAAEQIRQAKEAEAKQEENIKKQLEKQMAAIAKQAAAYQKQHDERVKQAENLYEKTKKHIQDEVEVAKAKLKEIPKWVSIDVVLNLDQVQWFIDALKAGQDPGKVGNIGRRGGPGGVGGEAGYQFGGQIPGPIGAPRVAIVHGGETVTPVQNIKTNTKAMGSVSINLGQNTWADPITRHLINELKDKRVIEQTVDIYLDSERVR